MLERHYTMNNKSFMDFVRGGKMREKLAMFAHKQWSGWMEYLFSKCFFNEDGTATIPKWAVDRWQRQIITPFEELDEQEKESDRKEADGMMEVLTTASTLHFVQVKQMLDGRR
jgi:hypothetical protein